MVTKTSGLAGIAYWINEHYELTGDKMIDKRDPVVLAMKTWIDEEYENGRQTMLSDSELEQKLRELSAKLGS